MLRSAGAREPESFGASFNDVIPIVPVKSFERAQRFYCERLGFETLWQDGSPPSFGSLQRNEVRIFLDQGAHRRGPGVALYVDVEDLEAVHRECQAGDVMIVEPPAPCPWGGREMQVQDPDGNRLRLAD